MALYGNQALSIAPSGETVILTWTIGILQEADALNGEGFSDIATVSPVTLPITPSGKFYRLRFPCGEVPIA